MKKIILIIFLAVGIGSITQAQFLKDLKTKAKTAMDNSVDRSSDKVVDKAINVPADNITDTTLDKAGRKLKALFKKKKNKEADNTSQEEPLKTDSTETKPR